METKDKREQLKTYYHDGAARLQAETSRLRARGRAFVAAEMASFLAIIFFVVLITLSDTTTARTVEGCMAVAMFAAYVAIRNADVRNSRRADDKERLRKAYSHEEAYMTGDFSAFDDGQRYVNPHHPYTFDLDIFGPDSLYQRINRTVTTGGADRLAEKLSNIDRNDPTPGLVDGSAPSLLPFIACGVDGKVDTDAILQTLPELQKIAIPGYFGGRTVKAVAWAMAVGLVASIVAAVYGLVSAMLPIVWLFANFFVVQGLAGKHLAVMLRLAGRLQGQMQPLMREVRLSADASSSPSPLETTKGEALLYSFSTLTAIVETLVLRGHGAYKFFADAFGLRGLFLVAKFYKWRSTAADAMPRWIDWVAGLDARVSMMQFSRNHPEAVPAHVVDATADVAGAVGDGFRAPSACGGASPASADAQPGGKGGTVVYEARGLFHPFLGPDAVRNDFSIANRNFYIITGANMAGKSTFLRAIGVNYILAMNGMPVFADSLTVSRFHLFTSMRTSDDLAHGISYFNAELLRLKQLIDSLQASPLNPLSKGEGSGYLQDAEGQPSEKHLSPSPSERGRGEASLLILDEILKGTNSLDKLNGSRMFLRAMEDKDVTGIVATHDLELSKMEQESPRFHNFCFEIELGADVTYSYKITPGVARNQNATFLLRKMLGGQM